MGYGKHINPIAESYIVRAMECDPGEQLVIKQDNLAAARAFSFQLAQTRKLMQESHSLAHSIMLQTKENNGEYYVVISRTSGHFFTPALVIKNDGSYAEFRPDHKERKNVITHMLLDDQVKDSIRAKLGELSPEEEVFLQEEKNRIENMRK
jgi:hypothetical protein